MDPYRVAPAPGAGLPCPRCRDAALVPRRVVDTTLDECPGCRGVFVGTAALARVTDERDPVNLALRTEACAPPLLRRWPHPTLACPCCGEGMWRKAFGWGIALETDVCAAHGMWFDGGTLPALAALAGEGALGRARLEGAARAARDRAAAARDRAAAARGPRPDRSSRAAEVEKMIATIMKTLRGCFRR
jgi:Zn-finger nucleic acid-binding protein